MQPNTEGLDRSRSGGRGGTPDEPNRDLVIKRTQSAAAGVNTSWVVDPRLTSVTVSGLVSATYAVEATFFAGEEVRSARLEGFALPVDGLFAGR